MTTALWTPSEDQINNANITAFTKDIEDKWDISLPDYTSLHDFSISQMDKFWDSFWDFANIKANHKGDRILINDQKMIDAEFFPDAKLNFAENLLLRRDNSNALVFWSEDKIKRHMSWAELYDLTSRLAQALRAEGIKSGDVVAGFIPNMPEAIAAMLAASSIGAIWTSCSPDFGIQGVLDRFSQSKPKIIFTADGYYYNGKSIDSLHRVKEIISELPSVNKIIVLPFLQDNPDISELIATDSLDDFIDDYQAKDIEFTQLPFNHPLYIMYSSGTTGVPKCIIHGQGGTLLNQKKEHLLHCDAKPNDRIFHFTTCGWMMWNWLVTALSCEASLMLYDGSPFAPDGNILFDYADAENFTMFGVSAKYIDQLAKLNMRPMDSHSLDNIKLITSTGSTLAPESFDYVYENIKKDVQLSSMSGGTDIICCFMLGMPIIPVWRGEIQAKGLGMAIEVFDDNGVSIILDKGELVCTKPFPSMPIGFGNDDDGSKYHAAYFNKFDNIWCHGDFIAISEHNGIIVFGRSDATLNPGGVRIGTAEIYRQVESFSQVKEAIVIGQDWQKDTRVILFVILSDGATLDDALTQAIKSHIRQQCTPRHVPAKIIAIDDIPRTKSGKITELAVRDAVHGRKIKNTQALANPKALELYKNIAELQID